MPPFVFGLDYRITRGRLSDAGAIARIEADVFPEPLSRRAVAAKMLHPGTRYVVARHPEGLAGYFGFEIHGPTAHVIANATAAAHRRKGLATVLVHAGQRIARAGGARWFLGEVRRSNGLQLEILAKLGWRHIGWSRGFFGNGEDAAVVWLPLI